MQSSEIPNKSQRIFAQDASGSYVRAIPQTTSDPAAASFQTGFPPQTFTDEGAGGTPPDGRDFNGILQYLSAWNRWQAAGGPIRYDAAFQNAIGGYPRGAIVQSNVVVGIEYCSAIDNNMDNPDAGSANWFPLIGRRATNAEMQSGLEDFATVTPKGLKDNGYPRIVSQNSNENNGHIAWSNGYKRCWGIATFNPNGSTTITYPIQFDTWSLAAPHAARQVTDAQDNNPEAYAWTTTNFSVYSASDIPLTGKWWAEGF